MSDPNNFTGFYSARTFGAPVLYVESKLIHPPEGKTWRTAYVLLEKDSDGISAIVLNLPGCGSCGDTIEEAMANVREALDGCIECYLESGEKIPWRTDWRDDAGRPFTELRCIQLELPKGS